MRPERTTLEVHALTLGRFVGRVALAAAVLSITPIARAQSVNLYGVLDLWAGQNRATSAAGARSTVQQLASGGMTTSYWGLGGREDLGGGLNAVFALESFLRVDIGAAARSDTDAYWARAALIGLQSKQWGELVIGRTGTPTIGALFSTNAFVDSTGFGSSFINQWGGIVQGDTAMNNSVRYTSPVWSGFRVLVQGSLGEERSGPPDRDRGKAYDARLDYINGPLLATLSTRKIDVSTSEDGREQTMLIAGAAYDLKVVRLFAQHVTIDDQYNNSASNVDRSGFTLGARIPVGAGVVMLSHSRSSIDDSSTTTPSRRKTNSVGYDYSLSKRSDIYANLMVDTFTAPRGNKTERMGLGIRHRF
jgi:predicted porin